MKSSDEAGAGRACPRSGSCLASASSRQPSVSAAQDQQAKIQLAPGRGHHRCILLYCDSIMTSTISFGDANAGFQAGVIHGDVHHHPPHGRFADGPRSAALTGVPHTRATGDSSQPVRPHPLPPRRELCRPWNAARSDTPTMLSASIASSTGGLGRRGVSGRTVGSVLASNAGTGSRSLLLSTAIAPQSNRRRRGCSGRTPATQPGSCKASET